MSKGLKIAAPIALGATGLGLAGMGPLAGLLSAGEAAGAGAAAEGVGGLLGGEGLGGMLGGFMPGEWDYMDTMKAGLGMLQGGEQQQMPQQVVNQSAPRQPMRPPGSFMESADSINAKREEWLRKLGRGA